MRNLKYGVSLLCLIPTSLLADLSTAKEVGKSEVPADTWKSELQSAVYQRRITKLWDSLNSGSTVEAISALKLDSIELPDFSKFESLANGVRHSQSTGETKQLDAGEWQSLLASWSDRGLRLHASEWHHEAFEFRNGVAVSEVKFLLQLTTKQPRARWLMTGVAEAAWGKSGVAPSVKVIECETRRKSGAIAFQKAWSFESPKNAPNLLPLISHDLDSDGFSEIIMGSQNLVAQTKGDMRFAMRKFIEKPVVMYDTGVLADFTGNGYVDYIGCAKADGYPRLYIGKQGGVFPNQPVTCARVKCSAPSTFAIGDIDRDGDLDIWIGQYLPPYPRSKFPNPYYDANDGLPCYLLINKGNGTFVDATEEKGFSGLNRRCYTASFVDIDADNDLDLVTSNDFCGVEVHLNDGTGHFSRPPADFLYDTSLFGMSHSFTDLDSDGQLDMLAVGMSSTTARRLEKMNASPSEFAEHNKMRSRMAYGNRSYLFKEGQYVKPNFSDQLARTGWSWSAVPFDFNLDGYNDVFVSNGHVSGKSTQDYCSAFWSHDIYPEHKIQNTQHVKMLREAQSGLVKGDISWNGYETNVLMMNNKGSSFDRVDFLFGLGKAHDSRAALSDDFDLDGRPDLLVTEYIHANGAPRYNLHLYKNNLFPVGRSLRVTVDNGSKNGFTPGVRLMLKTDSGDQVAYLTTGEFFASQKNVNTHTFGVGSSKIIEIIATDIYGNRVAVPLKGDEKSIKIKLPKKQQKRPDANSKGHPA